MIHNALRPAVAPLRKMLSVAQAIGTNRMKPTMNSMSRTSRRVPNRRVHGPIGVDGETHR